MRKMKNCIYCNFYIKVKLNKIGDRGDSKKYNYFKKINDLI